MEIIEEKLNEETFRDTERWTHEWLSLACDNEEDKYLYKSTSIFMLFINLTIGVNWKEAKVQLSSLPKKIWKSSALLVFDIN